MTLFSPSGLSPTGIAALCGLCLAGVLAGMPPAAQAQDPSRCFSEPAGCRLAPAPTAIRPAAPAVPPSVQPSVPRQVATPAPTGAGAIAPAEPAAAPAAISRDSADANATASRMAGSLPLDPAIRSLRDRLPPDVAGLRRQLGLVAPRTAGTDLRGRTPSKAEILDAIAGK